MKLKNKKTGKIGILTKAEDYKGSLFRVETEDENGENKVYLYRDLKTFAENWEDMPEEESEEVCYIDSHGRVQLASREENNWTREKEIGNYFEKSDECQDFYDKLLTWKRLKDKGFKFTGWKNGKEEYPDYICFDCEDYVGIKVDLDLLFGGQTNETE